MSRRAMQDFCGELSNLLSDSARLAEARVELDAISAAIGTTCYMDPPDGGSVSLSEQVARMAKDAARYRKLRRMVEWRNGPGLYWYLPRGDRGRTEGERLDNSLDVEPT